METKNMMIVGVGGQGSLLASKLLGAVSAKMGYDVKVSEVHGMSQRGGSVVTYVRFGEKVYSPLICKGEADFILAFEKLEGARYLPYLKKGGRLIVNTQEIAPMAALTGKIAYPTDVLDEAKNKDVEISAFDALSDAITAGTAKAVNLVLLGYFAKFLPEIPRNVWMDSMKEIIAPKYLDINIQAFSLGYAHA